MAAVVCRTLPRPRCVASTACSDLSRRTCAQVAQQARQGLMERLVTGKTILCAEGYLLALARKGYISHGVWVPEFILEQPEVLRNVHHEFTHAGTDVTKAFQYSTHWERMKQISQEADIEMINRIALRIAKEVALNTGTIFAVGISPTNVFVDGDRHATKKVRRIFEEQVCWAKEEGADYIVAETLSYLGEAMIALDVIKSFDLPAVITFAVPPSGQHGCHKTLDDIPIGTACCRLVKNGALVVGTNCFRGPEMTLEVVEEIVKDVPPENVCALPLAYRTTKTEPVVFDLTDKCCPDNNPVYPRGVDAFFVSEVEIVKFTKRCMELGLKYIGICCGNTGNYTRVMAETLGRKPPASRYSIKEEMAVGTN